MSQVSLYHITGEMELIQQMISESDGELTPEIEEALDALEFLEAEKVENYVKYMRDQKRMAEAIREEARELTAMAQKREALVAKLEGRLKEHLKATDKRQLQAGIFEVKIVTNGGKPSIRPLDPDNPPPDFSDLKVVYSYEKAYEHLKQTGKLPKGPGEWQIDGVLVSRGERLKW